MSVKTIIKNKLVSNPKVLGAVITLTILLTQVGAAAAARASHYTFTGP